MGYALRRTWLPLRVATLPWNQWQLCRGMSGRFAMESVATFAWNRWQLCRGISGNFRAEYAILIVVHGQALQRRHGGLGSVRQILIEAGKPLLEIRGAGNQVFDILQEGRGVCDDDLGMIEVRVERSEGGGFRRAEEVIGHGHRGDTRDRPGNVVVKEDQRVGSALKGAEVEHDVRLPFEDEFP